MSKEKSTVRRSARESARKSQRYALVVLHARPPPSRDPARKKTPVDYISLAVDLVVFGYLAGIGSFYHNQRGRGKNWCAFDQIPAFLMVAGYTNGGLSILRFILPPAGFVAQLCFNFVMAVWGSTVVFPDYSVWSSADTYDSHYCHLLAFLTAFVFVVVLLIWFSVLAFVGVAVLVVAIKDDRVPDWWPWDSGEERKKKQVLVLSQKHLKRLLKDLSDSPVSPRVPEDQAAVEKLLEELTERPSGPSGGGKVETRRKFSRPMSNATTLASDGSGPLLAMDEEGTKKGESPREELPSLVQIAKHTHPIAEALRAAATHGHGGAAKRKGKKGRKKHRKRRTSEEKGQATDGKGLKVSLTLEGLGDNAKDVLLKPDNRST